MTEKIKLPGHPLPPHPIGGSTGLGAAYDCEKTGAPYQIG
jgi:hypothetical protein